LTKTHGLHRHLRTVFTLAALSLGCASHAPRNESARSDPLVVELQRKLDSLRATAAFPGATFGIALRDGRTIGLATGFADTSLHTMLRPSDRLMQGSVGKTYVAAVAVQLVQEDKLSLDTRISRYLGTRPWFSRLPNANAITVRDLMRHTSGLVRYEFDERFTKALTANPMREWTPEQEIAFVLDQRPPFAAGAGWEYSDTNYIVLGLILEQITGERYYDLLRTRLLTPLALRNTIPISGPTVAGLAQGYAGKKNVFGGSEAMLVNGSMIINPAFEWTGGGIASTSEDLARWGKLLYEGKAFDASLLPRVFDAVPAKLGPNTKYGLGVIVRDSPLGVTYGHSGFFPGYATEMLYVPSSGIAVAIQVNTSDPYPRGLVRFLLEMAATANR
jgi:D-alanyl-D-alanine carboxypeptidase